MLILCYECTHRLATTKMLFKASFNIVLYDKETTCDGSLKERWDMSYTIETRN